MGTFKKLVVLDTVEMASEAFDGLHKFAEEVEMYDDFPDQDEVHARIKEANAIVLSWKTQLTAAHIQQAKNLKYIGLACSFYGADSSNVAVEAAKEKNITITGIFDYGDPGVVEFILAESIRLLNGYGNYQWKKEVQELAGKKFGIIGLGTTGQLLAKALLALNVKVFYFSRTRKKNWEKKGTRYLPLKELAQECDLLSVHLPKNTKILTASVFKNMGKGKILINTSLGIPFQEKDLIAWIKKEGNFAIFDGDGCSALSNSSLQQDRVISHKQSAGWSADTKRRRGEKVLKNIADFLKE